MKLLFGFIAKCYWRNFADLISLLSSPAHFQLNFQYVFKYLLNQSKTYLKLKILFVFDVRFYAKALNWSSICHVWLQNTDLQALLFIDNQRLIGFLHKKTEQYLQTKVVMPWWGITCCLKFRRNPSKQNFITLKVATIVSLSWLNRHWPKVISLEDALDGPRRRKNTIHKSIKVPFTFIEVFRPRRDLNVQFLELYS